MVGDDNEMYVGGGDGSLTLYEHDGKEYVDAKQSILAGPVCAMAPIVGSDTFITASSTGKIYLVTKTSFDFTEISDNHAGAINAVRFSPGMSSHFATASDDGSVRYLFNVDKQPYNFISWYGADPKSLHVQALGNG